MLSKVYKQIRVRRVDSIKPLSQTRRFHVSSYRTSHLPFLRSSLQHRHVPVSKSPFPMSTHLRCNSSNPQQNQAPKYWINPDNVPSGDHLKKYCQDLTQYAKDGKLDPIIGRDDEIRKTIRTLSRRTKNNPVLIGDPGAGKTAIAEGLAQAIVKGEVPDSIKGNRLMVCSLSLQKGFVDMFTVGIGTRSGCSGGWC